MDQRRGLLLESADEMGRLQRGNQLAQCHGADPPSALGPRHRRADRQARLADTMPPEEREVLLALHEPDLAQRVDLFPPYRGLGGEAEHGSTSHPEQAAHTHYRGQPMAALERYLWATSGHLIVSPAVNPPLSIPARIPSCARGVSSYAESSRAIDHLGEF